jgi:hypothetical protein
MTQIKTNKARVSVTIVQKWLETLAIHCAGSSISSDDLKREIKLYAGELCRGYGPEFFTTESAGQIGSVLTYGWPTVAQLSSALMRWSKETGIGSAEKKAIVSEARAKDPRAAYLDMEGKVWLAFWDRRAQEIAEEGDPRWEMGEMQHRRQSKLANLASMTRTYAPQIVWEMIARPYQATREIDVAEFMTEWLRLAPEVHPERSTDPRRQDRDEMNF